MTDAPKKLFIKTYGCQMNVYDSDRMADALAPHGYQPTQVMEEADLVVLNTCHIREKASEKVFSELGRLREIRNEREAMGGTTFKIGVAGCVAQAEGDEIVRRAKGNVDLVFGPQSYHRLPDLLKRTGNGAVVVDPDMPFDRAALMGCAVVTGAGAIFNSAGVRPGEDVAVIGCGGIGLAAINAARIAGADRIIAIDPIAAKRSLAERVGATDSFDSADPVLREKIVELTRGGVHHAIEAVGRIATGELALALLRRGGTATIVGMMPLNEKVGMHAMDLLAEKRLQGSLMGSNRFPIDIPRLVDFYLAGRLDLDSLVAERIGLGEVNQAMERLRIGDSARSVIMFD